MKPKQNVIKFTHSKVNLSELMNSSILQPLNNNNTFCDIERHRDGAVVLAEFCQQPGWNGEQIAACQGFNLTRVSEGGAHHHRAVAKLLVVVVNLGHTHHTWGQLTKRRSALNTELVCNCGAPEHFYPHLNADFQKQNVSKCSGNRFGECTTCETLLLLQQRLSLLHLST